MLRTFKIINGFKLMGKVYLVIFLIMFLLAILAIPFSGSNSFIFFILTAEVIGELLKLILSLLSSN